jgi:hypothetical protein
VLKVDVSVFAVGAPNFFANRAFVNRAHLIQ